MTLSHAKPRLLVLVGPTAVGKTALSLEIAKSFGCEIISGDSMQIYRGMDIGTAKASPEERSVVPHHMIDIHDPDHSFSAAEFQERAHQLITEITERGGLPFIVGGTGLYVESLCYGFQFTDAGWDEPFRNAQQAFLEEHGEEALHEKLRQTDPASAERLHPRDHRRIIRALEVAHVTGKPLSAHLADQKKESPFDLCLVGLTMDRAILYKRIEERIDVMIEQGLVEEVKGLLARGYNRSHISMQAIGYKEIIDFVEGNTDYERAVELLKRNTRRYAKRQLSWFRHMHDIQWVTVEEASNFSDVLQQIHAIIAGKFHPHAEYTTKRS
ncbi:tRNA (adenosine(37)-N6)-dimethylallyltransferase MiaA [Paenibacillus contaminans]|uniref:tRNA dimethylallyltransferase n=1 Tax=Paenibacillus contaminans TaxID=450362 RepID=A0A329ML13_9BACL|nr:tRNA (adenosine(37)-N6)-dimethylallyltransferase MiaA [Paenibacillus contaminans]RAV20539.1 tRNA (adenosine(37)-N6)-dimethylallyltransferase MiaA [Paenibacillus contaminans]